MGSTADLRKRRVRLLSFGLALLLLTRCADEAAPSPPPLADDLGHANLLLVTFDTTRADHLGCYGRPNAGTPTLDRIAAEGVRVERALSHAPATAPSHASILTGLLPNEHGVRANGLFALQDPRPTLAETLSAEGFATAAFVSAQVLQASTRLDRGFQTFDDDLSDLRFGALARIERVAERTTDRALEWLARNGDRRWFLWIHYFDPHLPHQAPPEFTRATGSEYSGEISYADHHLGRLVATLEKDGLLDRTLLCVTADHGEGLDEHGEPTHGSFVYDSTMHVPLLLRHPALGRGKVLHGQVGLVDLEPTFLEALLGNREDPPRSGVSLLPALRSEQPEVWHDVVLEAMLGHYSHGLAPAYGLSTREFKYIEVPRPELYAWPTDPKEAVDLRAREPAKSQELRAKLIEKLGGEPGSPPPPTEAMGEDQRSTLAALGYVPRDSSQPANLRDPKDYVQMELLRNRAIQLTQARRYEPAEELSRQILADFPDDALTLGMLGHLQFVQDRHDEALETLQRALSLSPDQEGASYDLAKIFRARDELDRALVALLGTLRINPRAPKEVYDLAVRTARELGEKDLAQELGEQRERYYAR